MSSRAGKQEESVVVDVGPQLVIANRLAFRTMVLDQLEHGARRFMIDFARTGYVDSSGLGVLVSLSKKVAERGGELRIANLNDELALLFRLTKLDVLFGMDAGGDGTTGASVPAPAPPPPRNAGAEEPER